MLPSSAMNNSVALGAHSMAVTVSPWQPADVVGHGVDHPDLGDELGISLPIAISGAEGAHLPSADQIPHGDDLPSRAIVAVEDGLPSAVRSVTTRAAS